MAVEGDAEGAWTDWGKFLYHEVAENDKIVATTSHDLVHEELSVLMGFCRGFQAVMCQRKKYLDAIAKVSSRLVDLKMKKSKLDETANSSAADMSKYPLFDEHF